MRTLSLCTLLLVAPLAGTAVHPPAAQAQLADRESRDLAAVGQWAGGFAEFNQMVAAVFASDEFETMIALTQSEALDSPAVEAAYQAWQADYKARIAALRAFEAEFPDPPAIASPELAEIGQSLRVQRQSMSGTVSDIAELCVRLDNLIGRAISGDTESLNQVAGVLIERAAKMLDLENQMVEQSRQSIKASKHPNYFVMGMTIASNNFAKEGLLLSHKAITAEDRAPYIERMRVAIALGRKEEAGARAALRTERAKIRAASQHVKTDADRKLFQSVDKLWDNFEMSIEVEATMLDIAEQQLALYESNELTEALDDQIIELDEQIYILVDERLRLGADRAEIVSKF